VTDESLNGIQFKGSDGTEISASLEAVNLVLASLERMWNSALEWAHSNPPLFVAFLIFLLIALFIFVKGRSDIAKMKLEYENARKNAKTQNQLPLDGL
jgi:hypothetical protein